MCTGLTYFCARSVKKDDCFSIVCSKVILRPLVHSVAIVRVSAASIVQCFKRLSGLGDIDDEVNRDM